MKNSKEWFSIKELMDENLNLPSSDKGIVKKAEREGWKKRQRDGVKGKTFEYHYSSLPKDVQKQLGFETAIEKKGGGPFILGGAALMATGAVERKVEILNDDVIMIDSYSSINVSAGFGSFNEGVTKPDEQTPYSAALLRKLGVNPRYAAVFWADGISMRPTIEDGDQMLVDLKRKEIKGDKIYLVQNGASVWVKRVKIRWDGVELISDNREEYPPIILSKDEAENLQVIGQLVHLGKNMI
ncbi:TPA: helix-turn-helix domain-containing protein [Haemophilus influenzae]